MADKTEVDKTEVLAEREGEFRTAKVVRIGQDYFSIDKAAEKTQES
jgi:hypothetical protein